MVSRKILDWKGKGNASYKFYKTRAIILLLFSFFLSPANCFPPDGP